MRGKRLTFIVIPPKDGQVREYHLSSWLPWFAGALCLALLASLGYYATGYYQREDQQQAVDRLHQQNEELVLAMGATRGQVSELEETMKGLIAVDEQLRSWHEMETLAPEERRLGVGGTEDLPTEAIFSSLPPHRRRQLQTLNAHIERLQLEARIQEESFAAITRTFRASGDSLKHMPTISPVPRGERAWMSSEFGHRTDPFTGRRAFHTGVDLAGRRGTPVVATADGIVTHAYYDRRLGNVIVIEHDVTGTDKNTGREYRREGIYRTEYGHLYKMLVKKGVWVARTDTIGTMGSTGRSTGPHLHYAVRHQDRSRGAYKGYVDPREFLLDIRPRDEREITGWLAEK